MRRVQAELHGDVLDFGWEDGVGRASWAPESGNEVGHALALCREYGVRLALGGLDHADVLDEASVLWVEPGEAMAICQPLPNATGKWLVHPGCSVAQAREAGLTQFDDRHDYLTVSAWLADRRLCHWPAGQTWRSGLVLASVLMADGSAAVLGPFGPDSRAGLDTLFLQRLVPTLFQLAHGASAQACRQAADWPGRYRLDAMTPQSPHQVNLSHLLLGHGGDLAWVQWLVFEAVAATAEGGQTPFRAPQGRDEDLFNLAAQLDDDIKALFDPVAVFPHPGQHLA